MNSPEPKSKVINSIVRPTKLIQIVISGWIVLYLIAPIRPNVTDPTLGLFFLFFGFFAIWCGAFCGERIKLKFSYIKNYSLRKYIRIYWIAFCLGSFGVFLRLLDWIVFRGLSYGETSFRNRELLEADSGNILSIIALLLVPMILAAFILRTGLKAKKITIGTPVDFLLCLSWPAINLLVGSRSTTLVFIFILVTLMQIRGRIKIRHSISVLACIIGALLVINAILFNRFEEMGIDFYDIALSSGYTHLVPLSDNFMAFIYSSNEVFAKTLFLFAHYIQYAVHGVFEFIYLFNNYQGSHSFGQYQFFYPIKAIRMFMGYNLDIVNVTNGIPRIGIYDTFFGTAYVDFSFFAIPFSFLFGLVSGCYWQKVKRGDLFSMPVYIACLYVLALVPIVNGFLFSGGLFYILSFMMFKFISKFKI